jgi:16S rRNA G966 N2-methylase RsmD
MLSEFKTTLSPFHKSAVTHLNRQIPPQAHTPMYNWHKFWSRKTWNVVAEFIKTYCPPGGIVFDPFAGSGVVAIEALKHGRKAIVCDILPISTEIIKLTVKPVSLTKLQAAYQKLETKVKNKILSLYQTKCRNCGHEFPFTCAIWQQQRQNEDTPIKRKCIDIRYASCPRCGDRRDKNTPLLDIDQNAIENIEKSRIEQWYPKQKLYHANGRPFMKKERYESVDELFTKRNLQALAWLMEGIEEEKNRTLRDFLKIAFTSMVHNATSMMPVGNPSPSNHYTFFSSPGWTQHSYWFVPIFMEQNVWKLFESAMTGHQGIIKAKEESNKYFEHIRFASTYREVIENNADIFIYTGSCFDLMAKMSQDHPETDCVDYIFTDPPYDASIQYGELAFLWITWLKKDTGYLDKIASDEVIRNEKQNKDFNVYRSLLSRSFQDIYGVLKSDAYLTVTFHNPTFKVRNATIYAGIFAGFEYEKIHHQPLGQLSAKSMLQPFGSAQGDFYLRFYKPPPSKGTIRPVTIDEVRFEKIAVETAIRVIAQRGEPTPYTIIINTIDPELAKLGYFSELQTGLDIKTVLQQHLDKEFVLVPVKIGETAGKLWWFKNPSMVPHLKTIPLTERVEQTVLRKLQQRGRVTFTEIWDAVSSEFPNSLTSDSMSILTALKTFGRPVPGGYWLIKPGFRPDEIEKDHTAIIAILAEIGKSHGFEIWIGKVEQSHKITSLPNKNGELKQYVTFKNISRLTNIKNYDVVKDIDLIWIKDNRVASLFEVESTTSMTSGLQRGSNVDSHVIKFLVLPEERETQLFRKLKSPMFEDRFTQDNWRVLYFQVLREEFSKHKGKTDINKLINKKITPKTANNRSRPDNTNQLSLWRTTPFF